MNLPPALNKWVILGLWGAAGLLACAGQPLSARVTEPPSNRPLLFPWKVAVVLEDHRPPEERTREVRKQSGDIRYPHYTYDQRSLVFPMNCGFAGICSVERSETVPMGNVLKERIVESLRRAQFFSQIEPWIDFEDQTDGENLQAMREQGFDAVLTGKLFRWYGLSYPFYSEEFHATVTGGVEYPKNAQNSAEIRLEEVGLIELETGRILWKKGFEYGFHRKGKRTLPHAVADEAAERVIREFLQDLSASLKSASGEP